MNLWSLLAICSLFLATVHANADFQKALELTRTSHQLYLQGEYKKSYELLIAAYTAYSDDFILNENMAQLATKIHIVGGEEVFPEFGDISISLGVIRKVSVGGKRTNYFKLSARAPKNHQIVDFKLKFPNGELLDIMKAHNMSDVFRYSADDPKYALFFISSIKDQKDINVGLYTLYLRQNGLQEMVIPIFLLPDGEALPKMSVGADRSELNWEIPKSKYDYSGAHPVATIYQHGPHTDLAFGAQELALKEHFASGKIKDFIISKKVDRCRMDFSEIINRKPFSFYYMYEVEIDC